MKRIDVARDYHHALGIRYPSQGPWGGQDFREKILDPALREAMLTRERVVVDFDGCLGLPPSFSEESFGGIFRIHPDWTLEQVNEILEITAPTNRKLWPFIDMAKGFMRRAASGRR